MEIRDVHEFTPLRVIADFAALAGTYQEGFVIVIEPYNEQMPTIPDPTFQFSCMDSSLAIKNVFAKYNTVVITSGTLSPLDIYPKLLQFTPMFSKSFPMTLSRKCVCPIVITRGSDQIPVSTTYKQRNNRDVVRNYGNLLAELAETVPDGIVCFFTSYRFMEDIVSRWNELDILDNIVRHKLLFIETPSVPETALALANYRKACDSGRGAIFLSISRGKVAEGIDFDGHYGRAVVMFGVPFVNTESRILRARLEYLNKRFHVKESDFLTFDALRHAAQCIGRVIRNKNDYGIMVLADKRYNRPDIRNKLPQWINQQISDDKLNLSTDTGLSVCKKFSIDMAQPWKKESQIGVSLLTLEQLDARKAKYHAQPQNGSALVAPSTTTTTTSTTTVTVDAMEQDDDEEDDEDVGSQQQENGKKRTFSQMQNE